MGARSTNLNRGQNNQSDGHLLKYFRNTFTGKVFRAVPVPPFSVTGGTVTAAGGKTTHTFLASGTFTVTSAPPTFNVEYLVVAGGGGGGPASGGAGIGSVVNYQVLGDTDI